MSASRPPRRCRSRSASRSTACSTSANTCSARRASIVQVDVARIGGITPWLKTAHLAEAFNVAVCPHFLMELHVCLTAAVPNGRWVEYIPQLDDLTLERMRIDDGRAVPSDEPGLGIAWDFAAIDRMKVDGATHIIR